MKKVIATGLGTVMLLALTGCSGAKDYQGFFEDHGYAEVNVAELHRETVVDGTFTYVEDVNELRSGLDFNALGSTAIDSVLAASRMETDESGVENGYNFYAVEFKDKDLLEDVFDDLSDVIFDLGGVLANTYEVGYYKYINESGYIAIAFQDGNQFTCTEYYIEDDNIIILNGTFNYKSDSYADFLELCDFMGKECVLLSLENEPADAN